MREEKRKKLIELARKAETSSGVRDVRVEDDAQVSPGSSPGTYFVEAWIALHFPAFDAGHKVYYDQDGVREEATIMHVSQDGQIVFLDNDRWKHISSCKLVVEEGAVLDSDL